jgi:hypothetical protein
VLKRLGLWDDEIELDEAVYLLSKYQKENKD